jgi:hypothetical protein
MSARGYAMNCPKCNSGMELGTEIMGDWGHECHECGCIVCQQCGRVFARLAEAEAIEVPGGKDYYCPSCDTQIYSVDLYPE